MTPSPTSEKWPYIRIIPLLPIVFRLGYDVQIGIDGAPEVHMSYLSKMDLKQAFTRACHIANWR